MTDNHRAWDISGAIDYYKQTRNRIEDIYESERVLFFPLISRVGSILDIGCAAGGIYNIIRGLNPKVKYTGLDVSQKMVASAKKLFPAGDFRLTSGTMLDYPDNSFDMVMSLGVIHHISDYLNIIKEAFRVSKKFCLLDLPRLLPNKHKFEMKKSYMILKKRFHGKKQASLIETKVPYVLEDAAEIFKFLTENLKPRRILVKGYFGKTDRSAAIPSEEVCFTVVCLEKTGNGNGEIIADLPKQMRDYLKKNRIKIKEPFESIIDR